MTKILQMPFVYRTRRFAEMPKWYTSVFGATV